MRIAMSVLLLVLAIPVVGSCGPEGRFDGALGSEMRYAGVTEGTSLWAALSPDGDRLAIVLMSHVWIVPREGGTATLVTEPLEERQPYSSVEWTRDGTALVAGTGRIADTWDIRILDPGTGAVLGGIARPSWERQQAVFRPHPAAAMSVVVTHPDADSTSFWLHDLASGDSTTLYSVPGEVTSFDLSADAGRLVWESDGVITEVELQTGERLWISDSTIAVRRPSYSASGERLAFLSDSEEYAHLGVRDGSSVLTHLGSVDPWSTPTWTPEGDSVFVVEAGRPKVLPAMPPSFEDSGSEDGRVVSFSTRIPVRRWSGLRRPDVHLPGGRYEAKGLLSPALSPSGRRIAFAALGDLWITDVAVGSPQRVTESSADDLHPVWSPDETRLAFVSTGLASGSTVSVIHLDDREDVRTVGPLADFPTPLEAELVWSPDGRYLAYTGATVDDGPGIGIWDAEGRSLSALSLPRVLRRSPDLVGWTPSGDSVVVSAWDEAYRSRQVAFVSTADSGWTYHDQLGGRPRRTAWTNDLRRMAWDVGGHAYVAGVGIQGDSLRVDSRYPRHFSWDSSGSTLAYQSGRAFVVQNIESGSVAVVEPRIEYGVPPPDEPFVLQDISVVDGRGGPARLNLDVFVSGGRVVAVHPTGQAEWPEEATVIDGRGLTVLPGLINLHVHHQPPFLPAGAHLFYGVTTVRDMAQRADWVQGQRERLAAGVVLGPRLFHVGGWVAPEAGQEDYSWSWPVDTGDASTSRDLVWTLSEFGVWGIKTRSGDLGLLRATSRVAHEWGFPTTTHSVTPGLLASGLEGREHARLADWLPVAGPRREDAVATAAAAGLCVTPTLVAILPPQVVELTGDSLPTAARWLPSSLRASDLGRLEAARSRSQEPLVSQYVDAEESYVRDLHAAGVALATGTDNGPTFQVRVDLEIRSLVRAGLTPGSAIRAATLGAAECLGIEHLLGSIEVGKLADLLIIQGDPIADPGALEKVHAVVLGGRRISRTQLLDEIR